MSILEDGEIVGGQVADVPAARAGHRHVQQHQVDACAKRRTLRGEGNASGHGQRQGREAGQKPEAFDPHGSMLTPVPRNSIGSADQPYEKRAFRRFFSNLGPGLITGAADDDPSGISTYSVAGASFGYMPLWTAIVSFPLMAAVQLMCARLGVVTGLGLAAVIRRRYARWVLWAACALLILANV